MKSILGGLIVAICALSSSYSFASINGSNYTCEGLRSVLKSMAIAQNPVRVNYVFEDRNGKSHPAWYILGGTCGSDEVRGAAWIKTSDMPGFKRCTVWYTCVPRTSGR